MSVQYGGDNITFADGSTLGSGWTGFKNRIINGAMMIDQRNAGASVTPNSTAYTLDRWQLSIGVSSKLSVQQSTTVPSGFKNSVLITTASAYTASASDYLSFCTKIEGFNVADLDWGTANAKSVTLSFKVRSSLTGTFSGALQNSGASRSYPFTFVINSANTYEEKTVTIAGDTSGTWLTDNGIGIEVHFNLGSGSSRLGTAGAWNSNWNTGATGSVALVQTAGATMYITGVQLEKGSTATSFDYRPYGTELDLCKRYFQMIASGNDAPWGGALFVCQSSGSNTNPNADYQFIKTMRAMPSIVQTASQWRFNGSTGDLNLNGTWTLNTGISGPIVNGSDATTGRLQFSTNGTLGPVAEARIFTNGGYAALSAEL